MKQVAQNNRSGQLSVLDIPAPLAQPGHVLIANAASLISAGTERSMRESAQKSLLARARQRPDQVRRVLERMRKDGVLNTFRQVNDGLDQPIAMGYASAGLVLACGLGVQEFKPGDRVASNGPHAEVVCVPRRLCASIPDNVPFEQASFTVLGAIALQGARLAETGLGATVLVVGLGLVGQLAVALLKASGARVLGSDPDAARCELALKMGADLARPNLARSEIAALTAGLGVDAVVITASTPSQAPIRLAADAVRKKGRIVLVGVVGLELDRGPFFAKECEFVVSCSYGPGRYDPNYEERGHDYPAAFVRWTEQRNLQAVLYLMASGRLDVTPLISHRFPIEQATAAYDMVEKGGSSCLGVVLQYEPDTAAVHHNPIILRPRSPTAAGVGVALVGAGSFARSTLLPAMAKAGGYSPRVVCSAKGLSAEHIGQRHGFERAAADDDQAIRDPDAQAVFILTRHHQHAEQAIKAFAAGKHVFVEKPLCLTLEELNRIESAYLPDNRQPAAATAGQVLMVGFNRRFSPVALMIRRFFESVAQPLAVSVRFNAGAIPHDSWIQDDETGGGRIKGEACHAMDLAVFLTQSLPVRVYAESIGGSGPVTDDQCLITLRHANGAVSSIAYLAGGDPSFPKERIEVFGGGRVGVIEDFRSVTTCAAGRTRTVKLGTQDKGHVGELAAFRKAITEGGPLPIPWSELRAVTAASILAVQSIREGVPFEIP